MTIITISNLYPRPDQPTRGMFNYQLFREMGETQGIRNPESGMRNICLVPEWRPWRWPAIRKWREPQLPSTLYLPVFYLPLVGRSVNWLFCYFVLKRQMKNLGLLSDVSILASWLYPDAVAAARLAKHLEVPVWLRVHGTDRYHLKNRRRRRLILEAGDYAQGVICNARAVADDLAKWGVPVNKIHIIPNGVDTSLFRFRNKEELLVNGYSLSAIRKQSNQQPIADNGSASGGIILFVGNLVPIKGPDVLLKAFALLNVQRSPSLLIIGSGPMRTQLERLARELGVADSVHFLGNRPHAEVALWMNVADVLCLTSRSEGMPNVVVEALASGLPVVATAVGACPELLAGETAARVCPSENAGELAGALALVLGGVTDREALARRHSRRHSWRQQAEAMLALIDNG